MKLDMFSLGFKLDNLYFDLSNAKILLDATKKEFLGYKREKGISRIGGSIDADVKREIKRYVDKIVELENRIEKINSQIEDCERLISEAKNGNVGSVEEDTKRDKIDLLIKKGKVATRIKQLDDCKKACENAGKQLPEGCMKKDFYNEQYEIYNANLKGAQKEYMALNETHKKLMSKEDESQM